MLCYIQMGLLSIILIIIAFILAFVIGTLLGYELGFSEQKEKGPLEEAIRERQQVVDINCSMLETKTTLDPPSREKLDELQKFVNNTDNLCMDLDDVKSELKIRLDVTQLQTSLQKLSKWINKWRDAQERENKIDKMLDDVVDVF